MIVRYLDPLERLEFEIIQRREEGHEDLELGRAFEELRAGPEGESRKAACELFAGLMEKDAVAATPSASEPNELDAIRRASPAHAGEGHPAHGLSETELFDRLLGGWLGRAAGCLLGKPVERHMRPALREMLESNNNWPLSDYWTQKGMPQDILDKYPWKRRSGLESLRENISCMPEDDDLNYTMLNLHVMETCGPAFSTSDVATAWLTMMPAFQVFTSERVAYLNLLEGRDPPQTATFMNPFREWIGAQIRADLWGYVSLGNPDRAAEFAWRDARLSHTGNGIYGEMFFAAVIAGAFMESDPRKLVESALARIPGRSRFAKAIGFVLDLPLGSMAWEAVLDELHARFGAYHWVHVINNAALTVAALLAGDGDYEQTICNTVMGGWDTDSNGATAGSIIGVIHGARALPGKWIDPLNNRIRSSTGGFDNSNFTDLARRTLAASHEPAIDRSASGTGRSDDF